MALGSILSRLRSLTGRLLSGTPGAMTSQWISASGIGA